MGLKKILRIFSLLTFLLVGCYKPIDALRDINKAEMRYPKVVSDYVGEHFPCKPKTDSTIKIDTIYKDIEVLCPPSDTLYDTINHIATKIITRPVSKYITVPSKTITITKYVEDSAKIRSLSLTISQMQEELKKCAEQKEKKSSWILWLVIALSCSLLLNIVQLKK
jgi:hypothetical protein